jgi:GMP synthase-like glutamine amidotransferase
MNIHAIQHVPFEGLANIEKWVWHNGHALTVTRTYLDALFPSVDHFSLLIVMGGPMNIYEEEKYPWLAKEKRFVEQAINQGRMVLGICLGAQLVADVLGATVRANDQKEIGWFPVETTEQATNSELFADFPRQVEVFHWHGDTFSLPEGAIHVLQSEGCQQQGFVYREQVIGLQFHLEITPASVQQLITHCGREIVPGPYIDEPQAMLLNTNRFSSANAVLCQLLDRIVDKGSSST